MNVLHRRAWAGMAILASLGLVLTAVCAVGASRAEAPQPPDIWEVQGVWVNVTGIKMEFRIDGTYEMTVPVPFTDKVLLKDYGIYDMTEGVVFADSFGGAHFRVEVYRLGEDEALFRFTRNEEPAGAMVFTHLP